MESGSAMTNLFFNFILDPVLEQLLLLDGCGVRAIKAMQMLFAQQNPGNLCFEWHMKMAI